MNMSLRAADGMKVNTLCLLTAPFDDVPSNGLDVAFQGWPVILYMPVEVEINLMEHMAGHGRSFRSRLEAG